MYSERVLQLIIEKLSDAVTIVSFDCAIKSLGVAVVELRVPRWMPHPRDVPHDAEYLSRYISLINRVVTGLIKIRYIDVINLGSHDTPTSTALALKTHLTRLDRYSPDICIYEFQMNINDKSRMISNFITYHYAHIRTVRVPPTYKNTVMLHPHISHQTFLKQASKTYAANKRHTKESLKFWAKKFDVDLSHIPRDCLDDAADAFIAVLALLLNKKLNIKNL